MRPGDHPEFFRLPPPEGRSRESTIVLSRDGRFFHDGELVEHQGLADAWHSWISRHPDDGRYILTNGWDWTYFTVEGAPLFVRRVEHDGEEVWLHLASGERVPLDPTTLVEEADGALTATVARAGGVYDARFSRHAQAELAPALVERDGAVMVRAFGVVGAPRAKR
ncbi:MAG: hypothetical protein IT374_10685 [Polyangiaceae bacterium]|nr:hypothetical protein [Polyangiaceae bacterium]